MRRDIPTSRATASDAMPTLAKADLTDLLFDPAGLNKREAKEMVEAFLAVMRDVLESMKLSGFGSFQLRGKRQRPGRNPKTGEIIPIPPRRVVTFRPSQKH